MVAPVARATSKQIDINGQMWKIDKLSAYDGAYLGYILLNNALPPIISQALGSEMGEAAAKGEPMSKKQFRQLMQDLLKATALKMPSGWVQAVDELGNFQVPGLENDLVLCIRLVVEVIRFNFADFFADGGLLDSVGGLLGMSRSSTEE